MARTLVWLHPLLPGACAEGAGRRATSPGTSPTQSPHVPSPNTATASSRRQRLRLDGDPPLRQLVTSRGGGASGVSEGWDQGQEPYSYATHTRRSTNGTAVQANRSQSSEGKETGVETSETAVAFRWVISGVCGKSGITAPSSWELGSAPMTHRREDFLGFSCHSFVFWGGRGFHRGEGTA